MFEEAALCQHPSFFPFSVLLRDVIIPKAIVVVIVVERDEMLVGLFYTHLCLVWSGIGLPVEISHAALYFSLHFVVLNVHFDVIEGSTFLFPVRILQALHQLVNE